MEIDVAAVAHLDLMVEGVVVATLGAIVGVPFAMRVATVDGFTFRTGSCVHFSPPCPAFQGVLVQL